MTRRHGSARGGGDSSAEGPAGGGGGEAGGRLRYRLLTGPDDAEFCRRVSEALADGYVLHGSPSMAITHGEVIVAQAVVLPDADLR